MPEVLMYELASEHLGGIELRLRVVKPSNKLVHEHDAAFYLIPAIISLENSMYNSNNLHRQVEHKSDQRRVC